MEIELRDCKKNVVALALVSNEDFDNVSKHTWHAWKKNGKPLYAKGLVNGMMTTMHQFVLGNPAKGMVIDHKNNNGLDNQRHNIHFVSYSANNQNRKKRPNTKNKYIGVKPWKGKFAVDHGGIRLGTFKNEEEAAKHYDKYVTIKYKDGHPKTNFPVDRNDIIGLTLDDLIVKRKKLCGLPRNISFNQATRKYIARQIHQGVTYSSSTVDTLEEAIDELEKIQTTIDTMCNKEMYDHHAKPIARNADNEAVIVLEKKDGTIGECIVDDDVWHDISVFKWFFNGKYAMTTMKGRKISMHRYLMEKTNADIVLIDHINNNCLDNRTSNLRLADYSLNSHNKKKKEGFTSKFIGVHRKGSKWVCHISFNNVTTHLGTFATELEAAKAYNLKAIDLYGSNANLNNIDDG
jgi:hypothetical protein